MTPMPSHGPPRRVPPWAAGPALGYWSGRLSWPRRAASACLDMGNRCVHGRHGPCPHQRSPPYADAPVLATGPNPWGGDLECGEGPARRQIQGTKVRPAKGQVAHHLGRLDNPDDLPRGRDDPDAAGAHAPHPPRGIDFETVRDTERR